MKPRTVAGGLWGIGVVLALGVLLPVGFFILTRQVLVVIVSHFDLSMTFKQAVGWFLMYATGFCGASLLVSYLIYGTKGFAENLAKQKLERKAKKEVEDAMKAYSPK